MLRYSRKDIFGVPIQTIVNTVNCVGVMGKGVALEVRKRFPDIYKQYAEACKKGEVQIGRLRLFKDHDPWVLNFPTKRHWRESSKLEYIERGLRTFAKGYRKSGIQSVAFPKLGCGSGGLEWKQVKLVMEKYLKELPDIDIVICLGRPKPAKLQKPKRKRVPDSEQLALF